MRQGLIRRVVKGAYVDAVCPDTLELRAASLALVIPENAVVTDRTAAWLHGVSVLAKNDHLAVPPVTVFRLAGYTRVRTRANAGGERTLLASDIEVVHGVRVTTPLRTALDLGRLTRRDDAIGCLDALLRTGRFSREELLSEIPRFRGYRGVVQLRELAPLADARAESMPESVLRLRWIDTGLPAPEPQQWICDRFGKPIYRVDLGSNTVPYAAEYDGEEFHTEPEQLEHDERLAPLDPEPRPAGRRLHQGRGVRIATHDDGAAAAWPPVGGRAGASQRPLIELTECRPVISAGTRRPKCRKCDGSACMELRLWHNLGMHGEGSTRVAVAGATGYAGGECSACSRLTRTSRSVR